MKVTQTSLPGVLHIEPEVFGDARGFFLEAWNERKFADAGITARFVQDNHSASRGGVVRGLHYQIGRAQAKLVRVLAGAVFDVAVDIRVGSPHFGRWEGVILSAERKNMLYVPEGFAHGFCALGEGAEFFYKCTDFYSPEHERGIRWNDSRIGINWPLPPGEEPVLSGKDRILPELAQIAACDLPVYTPHS